jgi:hypothetical protein
VNEGTVRNNLSRSIEYSIQTRPKNVSRFNVFSPVHNLPLTDMNEYQQTFLIQNLDFANRSLMKRTETATRMLHFGIFVFWLRWRWCALRWTSSLATRSLRMRSWFRRSESAVRCGAISRLYWLIISWNPRSGRMHGCVSEDIGGCTNPIQMTNMCEGLGPDISRKYPCA